MAMNLSIKCPHCRSKKGELCKEACSANGNFIKQLNSVLRSLNLTQENFKLILPEKKGKR